MLRLVTITALWALIAGATADAQTGAPVAALRVTVLDPTGAVIVSAVVTVESEHQDAPLKMVTDGRGDALFAPLTPGRVRLRVEAEGFETVTVPDLSARNGELHKRVTLPLARRHEELTVRDVDALRSGFVTVLTPAQIQALPDDPEQMEQVLRDLAGPGNPMIRVDGFTGVSLPSKSEIQSIRFRRNEFAAEHHARGSVIIEVTTKPGAGPVRGSIGSVFRAGALNARNPFLVERPQDGRQQYDVQFNGPLWRDRTSFSVRVGQGSAYAARPILAALVTGPLSEQVRQPTEQLSASVRVKQALPAAHLLNAYGEQARTTRRSLGVGGFNLRDRAYSSTSRTHAVGVVESGPIGRHLFSEFRAQYRATETTFSPLSTGPALVVLDAFQSGGAQIAGDRTTRTLEIEHNVDIAPGGAHALRAGVLFERAAVRSNVAQNTGGTFTFAGLDDFVAGRPLTFVRRMGDPHVEFAQSQFGWYAQDDIRVAPSLLLAAGVRHEWQSHAGDWLNLSPRVGLTWAASSRTTIYSGGGWFHDWLDADTFEQTLRVDGERQWEDVILAPGYPDYSASGRARSLPRGHLELGPALQLPRILRVSTRVQHRPIEGLLLTATYADERGRSLFRGRNLNAPLPGGSRPDPRFGNVIEVASEGRSRVRSFVVGVTGSTRRHGSATANYELASARNDTDDPFGLPADNRAPSAEWGPARNDVRHRLTVSLYSGMWKGLKLDTRMAASSALPYTITTGFDDNGDAVVNDRPAGVGRNGARGSWQRAVGTRLTWRRGFGPPAPGTSGFSGSGAGDVTIVVGPRGTVRRLTVILYLDAQNVFNHVNYLNYSGVMTSPFFGQPTAAAASRQLQLGAQFVF